MRHTAPTSRSEETEPDYFIVAQEENHTDRPMLPPALILRRDCNDLLTLRDEPQQVIPGEVLRDRIADQISDLTFARPAITLRNLLATAPLAILPKRLLDFRIAHERDLLAVRRPRWNVDCALPAVQIGDDFRLSAANRHQAQIHALVKRMIARRDILRK